MRDLAAAGITEGPGFGSEDVQGGAADAVGEELAKQGAVVGVEPFGGGVGAQDQGGEEEAARSGPRADDPFGVYILDPIISAGCGILDAGPDCPILHGAGQGSRGNCCRDRRWPA